MAAQDQQGSSNGSGVTPASRHSRPRSRQSGIEESKEEESKGGNITPTANQRLLNSLKQILERPDKRRLIGQDYLEEPASPEY